jgi:formate-nitrite transporter family protein
MFANAVISGWIIATMVWMFPSAGGAKLVVIVMMTWLVALGDLAHIVVGSVEVLYLVFNGSISWHEFLWPFALPTLLGNITGGTLIFALISHAQIRNDMSEAAVAKAKAEKRRQEKRREREERGEKEEGAE